MPPVRETAALLVIRKMVLAMPSGNIAPHPVSPG
jgi:hypothetical protein